MAKKATRKGKLPPTQADGEGLENESEFLIDDQPNEIEVRDFDMRRYVPEPAEVPPLDDSPYKKLQIAVLSRHLRDLGAVDETRKGNDIRDVRRIRKMKWVQPRDRRAALHWILDTSPSDYAFSFYRICDDFNIPKDLVYEKIGLAELTYYDAMRLLGLSCGSLELLPGFRHAA